MNDVDGIIHTASPRTLKREKVVKEGILGTSYLIDYWKGGNFIYCSSQGVIGIPPKESFNEDLPYNPIYWYDIEKICCELLLLKKLNEEKGFNGHYIIFRIPHIFASNSRMDDYQFLYPIIQHAIKNLPFVFKGIEKNVKDAGFSWVDARDMAIALVDALSWQESGIYNIANGFVRWIDLIEMIKKIIGSKSEIVIQEETNIEEGFFLPTFHCELDISKLIKKGFVPRYTIYQTISECIDFYVKAYGKSIS